MASSRCSLPIIHHDRVPAYLPAVNNFRTMDTTAHIVGWQATWLNRILPSVQTYTVSIAGTTLLLNFIREMFRDRWTGKEIDTNINDCANVGKHAHIYQPKLCRGLRCIAHLYLLNTIVVAMVEAYIVYETPKRWSSAYCPYLVITFFGFIACTIQLEGVLELCMYAILASTHPPKVSTTSTNILWARMSIAALGIFFAWRSLAIITNPRPADEPNFGRYAQLATNIGSAIALTRASAFSLARPTI